MLRSAIRSRLEALPPVPPFSESLPPVSTEVTELVNAELVAGLPPVILPPPPAGVSSAGPVVCNESSGVSGESELSKTAPMIVALCSRGPMSPQAAVWPRPKPFLRYYPVPVRSG